MAVLRVTEPFACGVDGVPRVYRAGDLVQGDDKVVKGREQFFVEVEEFAARAGKSRGTATVEQATAAPGEKRSISKRTASKKTAAPKR